MYKNYPDDDLMRVYSTMMENSGEISKDLKEVIEQRGGIEFFKRKLAFKRSHPEEFARITTEVQSLTTTDSDFGFVQKLVTSNHIPKDDLGIFIQRIHLEYQNSLLDKTITKDTVLKSAVGLLVASFAAGIFWWGILIIFHQPFYFILPVVYFVAYFIIKSMTKQSSKNPVVLISSLIAAFAGILLGKYLYIAIRLN